MTNNQFSSAEVHATQNLDMDLERQLLASKLVSEVFRSTGHLSFTFTVPGAIAFAQAMQLHFQEQDPHYKLKEYGKQDYFLEENENLISKKDLMQGFNVSHTTLWKWQRSGYLVPVKVGKRVFYKREDLEKLIK